MKISRDEALKAVDDIFNYCEEIDNSLPENERSGYKMLPDIHKIRKYIIENDRPHGEWKKVGTSVMCSICEHGWGKGHAPKDLKDYNFCPNCGALTISSNSEIEKSKSEIVPDYRDGWRLREGEAK